MVSLAAPRASRRAARSASRCGRGMSGQLGRPEHGLHTRPLTVSGAAGTASTLLSLQHRAETEGGLHADGKLALDLLSLATNFASLGGFTQTIQRGSGLVRGMYYGSMAGLAGAQGYLIAAETKAAVADLEAQFAVQIARAPEAERQSLRKQRDHAIASAIGDAIISGGFLLVSVAGIINESLARRGSDVRPYVEEAALSASPERIAELLRNHAEGKAPLTAGERKLLESVAGTPGTRTAGGKDTWPATKQEPGAGRTGQTPGQGTEPATLPGSSETAEQALARSEAAGGHLVERHVGESEAALSARLARESRIPSASTFISFKEAVAAVETAFRSNATRVEDWVAGGARGRLVLNAGFTGGLVLSRGAAGTSVGTGVRLVLVGNGRGGWYVLTGFPTP